ncbi:MAG TPA: flagellar hook-associated protein FlgK [Steroidobacteraceae bacterium]|nr:flagellar hook-associated protein FlgK [Steroidobacteraceae bacterium]
MLNVALSGLRAFQTALNTTSNNISNASTPGYSRERVDLSAQPGQGVAGLTVGAGVSVAGISRYSDDLLSAQMRSASSSYSRLDAYADKAGDLNNLFSDSTTGLTASLQDFTNALQSVANTPADTSARQTLLSQAGGLVTRLQSYQAQLDQTDADVNDQLRADATSISSIAQNIAQLNQQIAVATGSGNTPNDLLDARDQQLANLAALVDTSVVKQDDGSVNVFIGKGQPLVVGGQASQVVAQTDQFIPNRVTLAFQSSSGTMDITSSLSGGSVGGLLDFRSEMLDPERNELGRIAVALTDVTNAQHQAGQDLYGDMGGAFFAVGGVEVLGGKGNTGSATLSATRTDTGQLTAADYILRYDGSNWQVQRTDTGAAVAYTVGSGGALQFDGLSVAVSGSAQAGDQFMVQPTSGAIDGMQVLITDPSRIAAAAPIRTAAASGNTGTATISDGEVLDAGNAALRSPVTIEFDGAGNWQALDSTNAVLASGAYAAGGNIDVNGWRVQVSGQPAAGDSFTVSSNVGGTGDNRNALKLAAVLNQGVLTGGSESLDAAANRLVSTVGVATNQANTNRDAQKIIYDDSSSAVDSLSGVNLDEEAADMLRYQQAYQAAAQMISTAQTLFETILSAVNS